MFSEFEKIYLNLENESDIQLVLNNVNENVTILYTNNIISKYLFRKGIENINFIANEKSVETNLSYRVIKIGKPDLIIYNSKEIDIRDNMCSENNITSYNFSNNSGKCGKCKKITKYSKPFILQKICSEECAGAQHPQFYDLILDISEYKNDSSFNNLAKSFNTSNTSNTSKNLHFKNDKQDAKLEKFQKIMVIESKRLAYQTRKEEYKRSFRSNSNKLKVVEDDVKPENKENKENKEQVTTTMCKAKTKKGSQPCSNKALSGSEYCGIVSHRNLDPNYENRTKKKSSNKFERLKKSLKIMS